MKLYAKRGDTKEWPFQVFKPDGSPQTLVGATITFTARSRLSDPAPAFVRTIGAGIEVTDPVNGELEVKLAEANTSALTRPKTFHWDLEVVDAAGDRLTVAEGQLYVSLDVSHA